MTCMWCSDSLWTSRKRSVACACGRLRRRPSFPTRRSSDLAEQIRRHIALRLIAPGESLPSERDQAQRSEEHTSELQSLRHIVCRLLLEKKKTRIILDRAKASGSVRVWPIDATSVGRKGEAI